MGENVKAKMKANCMVNITYINISKKKKKTVQRNEATGPKEKKNWFLFACLNIFFFFMVFFIDIFKEKEGRTHWFVVPLIYAFVGSLFYVPWLGIEPTALAYWFDPPISWDTRPGPKLLFLRCKFEGLTFDPSEYAHFSFSISLIDCILKTSITFVNSLIKIIVSFYTSTNILIAPSDEKVYYNESTRQNKEDVVPVVQRDI